jgi:predicted trehalose synthase
MDLDAKARAVLDRLVAGLAFLPAEARAAAEQLRYRGEELLSRLAALMPSRVKAVKTRCHGSLGLGQVLVAGNDLVLVDFAGNPERPLAERRAKRCPLVDLASLIWSGALVARQALEVVCRQRPVQRDALALYLSRWRDELSRRLVSAYEAAFHDAPGLTEGAEGRIQARALLRLFVLERALEQLLAALDGDVAAAWMPLQSLLAWMEATAQPSGPGL